MVLNTNAIVDPGTVVVETLDTPMTHTAVSTPDCPDGEAVRAEMGRIKLLQKPEEFHPIIL